LIWLVVGGMITPGVAYAQVAGVPSSIGQIHKRIPSMSPFTGPPGTEVTVRADGLQPNRNYQVAIGEMQGCGYQVCAPVQANARGELVATVEVPDWAHTHHYEVVMILGEDFVPVAVSDPFHVSDSGGLVRRQGVIGTAWPGCASLEGEGAVTYALVGRNARTLIASEGEEMIIEGRIVEGACTLQYAIEVESMELAPGR
jgi:hypothetical protein